MFCSDSKQIPDEPLGSMGTVDGNCCCNWQYHALRPGMVFEHDGEKYTLRKDDDGSCYFLMRDRDAYGHVFGYDDAIGGVFKGHKDNFKLISVPVETGMVYEVGDRFMRTLYMQKYVLTCGGDGRYALINNANGDYYAAPSAIEDVFSDNEDSFSLLVN